MPDVLLLLVNRLCSLRSSGSRVAAHYVARCVLQAARCMLHAACFTLHVARCMLRVARCVLHAACCTLHVRLAGGRDEWRRRTAAPKEDEEVGDRHAPARASVRLQLRSNRVASCADSTRCLEPQRTGMARRVHLPRRCGGCEGVAHGLQRRAGRRPRGSAPRAWIASACSSSERDAGTAIRSIGAVIRSIGAAIRSIGTVIRIIGTAIRIIGAAIRIIGTLTGRSHPS